LGVAPQPDTKIPSEQIPAGQPLKLRIHYDSSPAIESGRWYVSVNDKDVGYYRGNDWSGPCGAFKPDRIQWYGEVSSTTTTPCAEMGNGYSGSDSRAVGFSQLKSAPSTEHPLRHIVVTDPNLYSSDRGTSGKNYGEFDGDAFRYGGSGGCEEQQKSVKQQKATEKQKPIKKKPVEKLKPTEQESTEQQKPIEKPKTLVDPRLGFDPTSGRPGSTPNLFGGGFYPNKDITITESSPAGSRPVGVITPDASGSFDIMFQIPDSTPAGQITYTFRQEPDVKVSDTFLVGGRQKRRHHQKKPRHHQKRPQQADDPGESGKIAAVLCLGQRAVRTTVSDPAETRYGGAVDVKRATDLYAEGWTLRQIGAELGITATTVSQQLRGAGVTMRRGAPVRPASTQQILELRDQGLTWTEVAEQVDMTVSGAWSRYRRARPPTSPRLGRWQQVLADALDQNLAIGVRAAIADHLGRAPTRAELTAAE
jgi:hypothetical protein